MKTIFWDYNGTIIDDLDLCLSIENHILKQLGEEKTITRKMYCDLFCFPVIDYYHKIHFPFDKMSYEEVSDIFNELYDLHFEECPLCEGFLPFIQKANEKDIQNMIVSASREDKLLDQLRKLDILHYFTAVSGMHNHLAESKTAMAIRMMKERGIDPKECIYIGDTTHDYDTAKAMGIAEIYLVAGGHQSYEVLKKTGAHVYHSLKELDKDILI